MIKTIKILRSVACSCIKHEWIWTVEEVATDLLTLHVRVGPKFKGWILP